MIEIPVTISAFSSGILLSPIKSERFFSLIAFKPMQARTPTTVAATEAQSAIVSVLPSASMISWLRNISAYHFVEKPCHAFMLFPSLNERTISVPIGRYKKRRMRARYRPPAIFFISYCPPRCGQIFQSAPC